MMSCLFIMIMMKCDKGNKFVICGILLHQQNFIRAHFSMLKISLLEYCFVVLFCAKNLKTWRYAQWFFACSTPNTSASPWNPFCTDIRP